MGSTEYKDANKAAGYAHSIAAGLAAPELATEWKVLSGGKWEQQPAVTVKALSGAAVHAAKVAADDSTDDDSDSPGFSITGAKGGTITSTACYEAVRVDGDGTQCHYSINLMQGIVLLNGLPPSRLPQRILKHPLYIRSFGERTFEVCTMTAATDCSSGKLKTTSTVKGSFYTFELLFESEQLVVHERTASSAGAETGVTLELLALSDVQEVSSMAPGWADNLPIRLKEMHSHWYNAETNVVLLRGVLFFQREVAFFICDPSRPGVQPAQTTAGTQCFRVPLHRRNEDWAFAFNVSTTDLDATAGLRENLDQLVLHDSKAIEVLAKLEDKAFIHTYFEGRETGQTSSALLKIELPRFELRFKFEIADKRLHSLDYVGYHLAQQQQLDDTMCGFQHYLILERTSSHTEPTNLKILIPQGALKRTSAREGMLVEVEMPVGCDATIRHHACSIHPRFCDLRATSIESRLQLAGIYAMTGTLSSNNRHRMLGGEIAMDLVRKCSVNRSLSHEEMVHLHTVSQSCHRTPGLVLLCHDLELNSNQLSFLNDGSTNVEPGSRDHLSTAVYRDAVTEYLSQNRVWRSRSRLSEDEERHLLGRVVHQHPRVFVANRRAPLSARSLEINECPIPSDFVEREEAALYKLILTTPEEASASTTAFPIARGERATGATSTGVANEMRDELETSWNAHLKAPKQGLDSEYKRTNVIVGASRAVQDARKRVEEYALTSIATVPDSVGQLACAFRMQRLVGVTPAPLLVDLARASWNKAVVAACNPFLSSNGHTTIREAALLWGKLCVLEDKLCRLVPLLASTSSDAPDLIQQELESRRVWSTHDHPRWLTFELEFGLQIRPKQHFVAQSMIDSCSGEDRVQPVVQLNMGEGKTRVILPMLALYYASTGNLPRLTILSPILKEAHEYLHKVLTASLQGSKVCTLPFVRDVDISKARLAAIQRNLERCRLSQGALLVAPEHRQSLHLKGVECQLQMAEGSVEGDANTVNYSLLNKLENSITYVDVLDESDEVLRPTTKLVYTRGQYMQLPSLSARSEMIQAVLSAVNKDESVLLLNERSVVLGGHQTWPGGFRALRIIAGIDFNQQKAAFLTNIATIVLKDTDPPYSLRWMLALAESEVSRELVNKIIEYVAPASSVEGGELPLADGALERDLRAGGLSDTQMNAVYMLRGLLTHDLLVHCLQKRHRVDFGIKPNGSKRIAVPFHGSDTPAPRAEFSHPDCGLMFTFLSYYTDGLKSAQVKQSFQTLLGRGDGAQDAIYSQWFAASKSSMKRGDADTIDNIQKIDLSNSQQLEMLCKYFAGNTHTVGFFLQYRVFDEEMLQFPSRIESTAWNLAHSASQQIMGFSGTKDNKLLFPTQLQFTHPKNVGPGLELLGTDGKMIQLIQSQASYHRLFVEGDAAATAAVTTVVGSAYSGGGSGGGAAAVVGAAAPSEIQEEGVELCQDNDAGKSNWSHVLRYLVDAIRSEHVDSFRDGRTTALIDAGAMMAGKTNVEVAEHLLQNTEAKHFRGVVYFSLEHDEWRVKDHTGQDWSKDTSPIHEREAFVFFDESRCRGADMRLEHNAKAVLCLGPKMQKDKLMQAAARLRQLSRGQQITLVAPRDVDAQIRTFNGLSASDSIASNHIVSWTLLNSEGAVASWMPEWSKQGAHFCAVSNKPELALIPEVLELKALYSGSIADIKAYEAWQETRYSNAQSCSDTVITDESASLLDKVEERMDQFGREIEVQTATLDQECERELEKEIELEQERQLAVEAQKPREEVAWDYTALYQEDCTSAKDLPSDANVLSLAAFVKTRIKFGVDASDLALSPNLYGTHNFFESCTAGGHVNEFLRWVDAVIELPSGDVLLVSEREADSILGLMWDSEVRPFKFVSMQDFDADSSTRASLRLFRGQTVCPSDLQEQLKAILRGTASELVARTFVNLRGRHTSWDRSDLEKVATVFAFAE